MEIDSAGGSERVLPLGSGPRQLRATCTLDSGYTPASDCFCVRFSPDDQYLAASFANGAIHVYDSATGKQEFVLNGREDGVERSKLPLPTTQLRWRPHSAQSKTKSVLISVNAELDGQVQHWHIKSGKCLHTITEPGNQLFCLDYFHDGSLFATAGKDRLIRIYDEATKRMVQTLEGGDQKLTAGHSNRVFSLKFHPEHPNIVLSGGWDNTVQIWDTRRGHSVRSLWNCFICGDAVDFSSNGEQILTGSWRPEDALQIWDFSSGNPLETVPWKSTPSAGTSMLYTAQFSKDPTSSLIVAGGSQENEVKFFDRTSGRTAPFGHLLGLPSPVFSVDLSHGSTKAAVGCADGRLRLLEIF